MRRWRQACVGWNCGAERVNSGYVDELETPPPTPSTPCPRVNPTRDQLRTATVNYSQDLRAIGWNKTAFRTHF